MVATTKHATGDGWSSRSAFILAAIGAAVGLGNLWRFPTLAGESGGGAFVIVYIACVFLLGLPLVLAEIFIGRAVVARLYLKNTSAKQIENCLKTFNFQKSIWEFFSDRQKKVENRNITSQKSLVSR